MISPKTLKDFSSVKTPVFKIQKINNSQWKDGLIIRSPNWLGDAVMTFPAINQIAKIIPEMCGLFIICPNSMLDLYRQMPIFDHVVGIEPHKKWKYNKIREIRGLMPGIGILFNNSFRDAWQMKRTNITGLYGASARFRSFLLQRAFHFPKRKSEGLNNFQHFDKYLSMVYAMGAPEWSGELPEFNIKKQTENPEVEIALKNKKILLIAPGAAYGPAKRWPEENFANCADSWLKKKNGTVILVGSNKEKNVCSEIKKLLKNEKIYNLAGKTSLSELMLIISKTSLCIANDSGVMHLAAALQTPGIAIFGSTDPSATAPISKKWKILYQKIECSPCFKRQCPNSNYKCLTQITAENVIEIIDNFQKNTEK